MTERSKGLDIERRDALRRMLTRLRDENYTRIRELRREQEQDAEPGAADSIEAARATADVETHASLIEMAENRLRFLDEALNRVESGTYGICADCGTHISLERLGAVPFARYCVACQEKRNHSRVGRAGQGSMIPPFDHQWTLPQEMREPMEYEVSTNVARPGASVEEVAHPQPAKVRRRRRAAVRPRTPKP